MQAARYGVDAHLIRMSVGLEDSATLVSAVETALKTAEMQRTELHGERNEVYAPMSLGHPGVRSARHGQIEQ